MKRLSFAVALGAVVLFVPSRAHAGPSNADLDEFFSDFGIEARGFGAVTGGFTDPGVLGGDLHVVIEGPPVGVFVGIRAGANLGDTQFVVGDLGFRYFFLPSRRLFFVGGGAFYGGEFTAAYAFSTGSIGGPFAEIGLEYPRTSRARVLASLRVDLGFRRARTSRPSRHRPSRRWCPSTSVSSSAGVAPRSRRARPGPTRRRLSSGRASSASPVRRFDPHVGRRRRGFAATRSRGNRRTVALR